MDYIVELKAQLKKAQEDEAYFRNHHSIYTNEQVDNWRRDLEQWQMKANGWRQTHKDAVERLELAEAKLKRGTEEAFNRGLMQGKTAGIRELYQQRDKYEKQM